MRTFLTLAVAGLFLAPAVDFAAAQTRRPTATPPRAQQAPVTTPSNPYGLSNCAERPFARECDRRGTW